MKIYPELKTVLDLFPISPGSRYRIPNYQRAYSWKPEQIEALFNDICNEAPGYYVGNLLVTERDGDLHVIDGQQRLTTISLFLLAIYIALNEYLSDSPSFKAAIQDQGDIKRQLFSDSSEEETRIALLDQDQLIYSDYMRYVLDQKPQKKWGNRVLAKRFKFIRSLLDDFETYEELKGFYQRVLKLELLKISVEELNDAFNIFSSLNAKGLPLTLFDLLKGEFISIAVENGVGESKVLNQWGSLMDALTPDGDDVDNGVVTQFLLNNYDAFEAQTTSSMTKGKALLAYRELIKKRYHSGEDYLSTLVYRAKVFAHIKGIREIEEDWGEQTNRKLEALENLDATQALPLLLYILVNVEKLQLKDRLSTILDSLISFYVRRNIVLIPKASGIRSRMLGLVREIQGKDPVGDGVIDLVDRTLGDMCADDDAFREALRQGVYDKNKKTARYILIAIEREIGKSPSFNKGCPDNLDEYLVSSGGKARRPIWTIEHILPEGQLPEYWVEAIAGGDFDKASEDQSANVHLLGNLTLTPYNSELSQKPFYSEDDPYQGSKRDYQDKKTGAFVGLRSGLFLNASIANKENGEVVETKTNWTIDDIRRRNEILSDYVVGLFKVPGKVS